MPKADPDILLLTRLIRILERSGVKEETKAWAIKYLYDRYNHIPRPIP